MEVQVVDQGPGIPLGYSGIIFERYKRIKDSRGENQQGIGLGLAISKTIITQHGGEIGVESEPGKGSTFWFRVPIVHKNDEPVMDRAVPLAGARLSA